MVTADLPCRCSRLVDRDQPCFNCRWNAATDRRECERCGRTVFFDFAAWRSSTGEQTCGGFAAHRVTSHRVAEVPR